MHAQPPTEVLQMPLVAHLLLVYQILAILQFLLVLGSVVVIVVTTSMSMILVTVMIQPGLSDSVILTVILDVT